MPRRSATPALAAAGELDLARPRRVARQGPAGRRAAEQRPAGPAHSWPRPRASRHRSLYLPLLRGLTPRSLEVFDFAEQGMVTGSRDTTTVATQALYLLNDPFVRRRALNLAGRLLGRSELDDAARVDLAYRLTLGRAATAAEVQRASGYLADYESASLALIASTVAGRSGRAPPVTGPRRRRGVRSNAAAPRPRRSPRRR